MARKTHRRRMRGGMPRSKVALAVAITMLTGEELKPVKAVSVEELQDALDWLKKPHSKQELAAAAKLVTQEIGRAFSFESIAKAQERAVTVEAPAGEPLKVVPVAKLRSGESYTDTEGRTFVVDTVTNKNDGTFSITTDEHGTLVVKDDAEFIALPSTWAPIGGRKQRKTLRRKK